MASQVVAELTCEVRVSRWLDPADNKELSEPPEPGEYKLHVTSEPPRDDAGCCGGRWQRVTLSTAGGHDKYAFANPKGIAVQAKFGSPFTPPMPQLGKQSARPARRQRPLAMARPHACASPIRPLLYHSL